MIEWITCRWARRAAPGDVILGKGRHLAFGEVFFAADRFVGNESLSHQESVGRDAQAGMVVESPPAAPLIVPQSEVLLEVLVVTLDSPALVSGADQVVEGNARWQGRQDVLDRLGLVRWPLDEQPLLWAQTRLAGIATRMANPHGR